MKGCALLKEYKDYDAIETSIKVKTGENLIGHKSDIGFMVYNFCPGCGMPTIHGLPTCKE